MNQRKAIEELLEAYEQIEQGQGYPSELKEQFVSWLHKVSIVLRRINPSYSQDWQEALGSIHFDAGDNNITEFAAQAKSMKALLTTFLGTGETFIEPNRINGLKSIQSPNWDFSKLIQLCEELNDCYSRENYFAVAMLARGIMDHIPPLFNKNYTTFAQVYSGSGNKSFKKNMGQLDNTFRNIADSFLHLQIRKKEPLPNRNQIDFSQAFDVLLSEIISISS